MTCRTFMKQYYFEELTDIATLTLRLLAIPSSSSEASCERTFLETRTIVTEERTRIEFVFCKTNHNVTN